MAAKKNNMGVKDRLMKKNLTQLKAQAKRLKLKGFSTKKKNDLVKSIMMAEARKKKSKTPMRGNKSVKRVSKKRGARPNLPMRTPVQMRGRKNRGMGQIAFDNDFYREADFDGFNDRQLEQAGKLLTFYADDPNSALTPLALDYFYVNGYIKVGFNTRTGYVFLIDEDFNVLLPNRGKLDLWITLPYSGEEGFYDSLMEIYEDFDEEDQEYLDSLK